MRNQRLLQLLLLFDEYHNDRREEEREHNSDMERLEAKLDAVIHLLAFLIDQRENSSGERRVSVAAHHMEWIEERLIAPRVGERLWILPKIDPRLPQSLKMAGSVIRLTPVASDRVSVLLALEDQGEQVQGALEKLIFRIHRREIARMRSDEQST